MRPQQKTKKEAEENGLAEDAKELNRPVFFRPLFFQ
jgi:hypothetical protein